MVIKLWDIRIEKKMTLRELEKKSGIPKSTLNNIENGKVSPTIKMLEQIAQGIDCKINDLFESDFK